MFGTATTASDAPEVGTLGYLTGRRMIDASGLINATNDFARHPSMASLAAMASVYLPDVILLDSPAQGAFFERVTAYRMVEVFAWDPWSTILIHEPAALVDASSMAVLRAALPARAHDSLSATE
jgi:hypothetical protein